MLGKPRGPSVHRRGSQILIKRVPDDLAGFCVPAQVRGLVAVLTHQRGIGLEDNSPSSLTQVFLVTTMSAPKRSSTDSDLHPGPQLVAGLDRLGDTRTAGRPGRSPGSPCRCRHAGRNPVWTNLAKIDPKVSGARMARVAKFGGRVFAEVGRVVVLDRLRERAQLLPPHNEAVRVAPDHSPDVGFERHRLGEGCGRDGPAEDLLAAGGGRECDGHGLGLGIGGLHPAAEDRARRPCRRWAPAPRR